MGEVNRMSRFSFIDDESPSLSQLPAFSLLGARFDSLSQRPLCRLADLFNPLKNLLSLPFVNRHPERLLAFRGLDDRDRQIAADVCLWLRLLRRLQDLKKLLGVGGWLEAREKI